MLDEDGGLTVYIQHNSPGTGKESNWLSAPAGPFYLHLRLYKPGKEVIDGLWSAKLVEIESLATK